VLERGCGRPFSVLRWARAMAADGMSWRADVQHTWLCSVLHWARADGCLWCKWSCERHHGCP
jgi:hypothetical protein